METKTESDIRILCKQAWVANHFGDITTYNNCINSLQNIRNDNYIENIDQLIINYTYIELSIDFLHVIIDLIPHGFNYNLKLDGGHTIYTKIKQMYNNLSDYYFNINIAIKRMEEELKLKQKKKTKTIFMRCINDNNDNNNLKTLTNSNIYDKNILSIILDMV